MLPGRQRAKVLNSLMNNWTTSSGKVPSDHPSPRHCHEYLIYMTSKVPSICNCSLLASWSFSYSNIKLARFSSSTWTHKSLVSYSDSSSIITVLFQCSMSCILTCTYTKNMKNLRNNERFSILIEEKLGIQKKITRLSLANKLHSSDLTTYKKRT